MQEYMYMFSDGKDLLESTLRLDFYSILIAYYL